MKFFLLGWDGGHSMKELWRRAGEAPVFGTPSLTSKVCRPHLPNVHPTEIVRLESHCNPSFAINDHLSMLNLRYVSETKLVQQLKHA